MLRMKTSRKMKPSLCLACIQIVLVLCVGIECEQSSSLYGGDKSSEIGESIEKKLFFIKMNLILKICQKNSRKHEQSNDL